MNKTPNSALYIKWGIQLEYISAIKGYILIDGGGHELCQIRRNKNEKDNEFAIRAKFIEKAVKSFVELEFNK